MESNSLVETLCVFCGTTVAQTDVYDLCTHCRSAIDYVCDSEDEIIRLIRYRRISYIVAIMICSIAYDCFEKTAK